MLGKRKATAAALEVGKKPNKQPNNHGGKRRGSGSKPTPTASDAPGAPKRTQATLSDQVAEGEVDNAAAGGFFGRYGRDPSGPRPTVIPQASPAAASPAAASPAAASPGAASFGSESP